MITYRKARPSERAKCLDFINMVFSMAHRPHDFRTLLPKVYGDGANARAPHYIAVDEHGNVRGLVAVLYGHLRLGKAILKTGYVGSVSVHPYARGEGHMKALMALVVESARRDGVDLLMLSGQRQRYEYFGFSPCGAANAYEISARNVRHALRDADASRFAFVPMSEANDALVDEAFALSDAGDGAMLRSREDFVTILQSWRATPWIVTRDGGFAGYFVVSGDASVLEEARLSDLSDLPGALKAWFSMNKPVALTVSADPCDVPLNRALKAFAEDCSTHQGPMLRVLNFPRVLSAFAARSRDGFALSAWIDGEPLTISADHGKARAACQAPEDAPRLTALEAQQALFSRLSVYDEPLAKGLPFPFYLSSPDAF